LAQFDGKEGGKSLIGFNGKIYDVTDSKIWKSGTHMMRHNAGGDLTSILPQAPHGAESIEKNARSGEYRCR
jgi:predicted heme/steroid binding protein